MSKFESLLLDFEKALKRFEDVLKEQKSEIVRDSAIKRFELVFDLAWKTIKEFLEEYHNIVCASPKTCLKEAFRQDVIPYNDYWLKISKDRNYTVHIYKEAFAEKIYSELPEALKCFQSLLAKIKTNTD